VDRRGDEHRRHQHPLPDGAAETIARLAARALPDGYIVVELEGWEFGSDHPVTPEELWKYNSATPDMVMPVAAAIERGPVKVAINGIDASVDELGDSVRLLHHRLGTFLSVVSPGVGKLSGVHRLLDGDERAWPPRSSKRSSNAARKRSSGSPARY
jgi:hypothetical protein